MCIRDSLYSTPNASKMQEEGKNKCFSFVFSFDKTLGSTGGREKAEVEGLLKERELSLERIGINVSKCGRYPGCDICGPLVPN